jgi:uracil phosphoribosyltransferase
MSILNTVLLSQLRRKDLSRTYFRYHSNQLALCLAHQASEYLSTKSISIQTPLGQAGGTVFNNPIVLVPILRSGLALLPGFMNYFPEAGVGFVGLRRDEKTAIASLYYRNIPKLSGQEDIIILDPMIATGGSAIDALEIITKEGIKQEQIIFVGVIASQEGIDTVQKAFPKIKLIVAATDKQLNTTKFIVPGLGDFGDRYFGTE